MVFYCPKTTNMSPKEISKKGLLQWEMVYIYIHINIHLNQPSIFRYELSVSGQYSSWFGVLFLQIDSFVPWDFMSFRDIIWECLLVGSGVQLQPYYIPKKCPCFFGGVVIG